MATLPLGIGAYSRPYARMPEIRLVNRFFEQNPANFAEGSSLLSRPVTKDLVAGGQGPLRGTTSQQGIFGGDLFFVSGNALFRYDGETRTTISGQVDGDGGVEFAFVSGPDFEHLFIADGLLLQVYTGTTRAHGVLRLTPASPPDITTQTVRIGTVYYQWTAGTPSSTADGTSSDPFEVAVGGNDEGSLVNLAAAINNTGTPGVTYSSTISGANTQVFAADPTEDTLRVEARERGTDGNSIVTTVTTSALAWDAATLENGGIEALSGVTIPNGEGAFSICSLKKFLIVAVGERGEWYFLRPGELEISPLDFYEAEDEPDPITAVRQVGDSLLIFGTSSIESWYVTGDVTEGGDAFLPNDGAALSFGAVRGTVVKIKDFVLFVGSDNIVYTLGSGLKPVSNNGISNRVSIARTIEREQA